MNVRLILPRRCSEGSNQRRWSFSGRTVRSRVVLPATGETFSRATHRKSPTFSFLTTKRTPFLSSSLTSSRLRWWLPLRHRAEGNQDLLFLLFIWTKTRTKTSVSPGGLDDVHAEDDVVGSGEETFGCPALCLMLL